MQAKMYLYYDPFAAGSFEQPEQNLLFSGDHIVANHVECSEFKGQKELTIQARLRTACIPILSGEIE